MAPASDVIVIGSGFGGAVTACRLAEAGYRVVVLERGRRWGPETFPRALGDPWLWDQAHPERRNGWLDMRMLRRVAVAQGAGVGGGSLIYVNVSTEADPSVFERGWPAEYRGVVDADHQALRGAAGEGSNRDAGPAAEFDDAVARLDFEELDRPAVAPDVRRAPAEDPADDMPGRSGGFVGLRDEAPTKTVRDAHPASRPLQVRSKSSGRRPG